MERQRVRMRFRKEGDLRLISHRDLLTAIERLFRRIGLKLSMSGGFHPRPRISFPLSLALGIRGLAAATSAAAVIEFVLLGVALARRLGDLGGRGIAHQFSGSQHENAIGVRRRQVQVVRDGHDQQAARRQIAQQTVNRNLVL